MSYDPKYEAMLDEALAATQPEPVTSITTAAPRRHRHSWYWYVFGPNGEGNSRCLRCGAIQDPDRSRRGRTVRSYGNRAELDVARTYGGRKVGHAQGPTDVMGKTTKTQLKTTRRPVPVMWRDEFAKLDREKDGRLARILIRFVRPGNLGPDDYFIVRGKDWLDWYGKDGD